MGLTRHHPSIGKLPCVGDDWRLSRPELDALIWREGEDLRPGGAAGRRRSRAIRDRRIVARVPRQVKLASQRQRHFDLSQMTRLVRCPHRFARN
jgi:hypothetical protein